jgi:hypothetical protein
MKPALFALALACFWALAPSAPPAGLARTVRAGAQALATTGRLDVAAFGDGDALPATVVHKGQRRPTTALGAIVALAPAELCARVAARIDGGGWIARAAESGTAAATAALVCVVFFGLLAEGGLSARAALGFTGVLALATPLVWFARVADGTALATLLLLVATRAARAFVAAPARGVATTLGAALAALILVEPTLLLAALVVVAWCGVHRRAPLDAGAAARVLTPLLAAILAVAAWRGHIGARPDEPGDLLQGLDGLLLSTGKSLFVYAPSLLLAVPALWWLWRTRRAHAQLVLVVAAALLLATARLDDWHGDPTWGPRRIVPLVPLALEVVALAWAARARAVGQLALAITVAAGLWVQAVGVALAPTTYLRVATEVRVATGADKWFAEQPSQCHFIPQFSPVVGHAWLLSHLVRRDRRFDVDPPYQLLVERAPPLLALLPQLHIDWFARDWPTAVAASWLGALGALAAWAAWTVRRRLV